MKTMQIFYDYECPYCKKGYEYLLEQIKSHPEVAVEWRPVESHPLPEDHPPHTYLACQSYYIARELGADMAAFHAAMFQAVAVERRNVEKPEVLCEILKNIVDSGKFSAALESGKYANQVDENNKLADDSGVWFVPAFRMNGKKLDARGGAGISPGDLKDFLNN